MTTWFAGLFYIIRLFIYYKEAEDKEEPSQTILKDQYALMSKRLWYIITWPSAVLATIFAVWLLVLQPFWLEANWMLIKLVFVALLFAYHLSCQMMYNQIAKGYLNYSSIGLRIWNEVATIILFACVFLVVLKTTLGWVFGVVGIVGNFPYTSVMCFLMKKIRVSKSWDKQRE